MVQTQAKGDFTQRIQGDWPGELNKLSTSINDAAGAVESMIHSIQGLSQEVAGSSQIVLGNSAMLKVQLKWQCESIGVAQQAAQRVRLKIPVSADSARKYCQRGRRPICQAELMAFRAAHQTQSAHHARLTLNRPAMLRKNLAKCRCL